MKRYMIERHVPGAGKLTPDELRVMAGRSNEVIAGLGPGIQWVHSYISDDAITCIYLADNEDLLRQHASRGPFPITRISEVKSMFDPSTAGAVRAPAARA
jgi:Protein of unknown function (DUF4242)